MAVTRSPEALSSVTTLLSRVAADPSTVDALQSSLLPPPCGLLPPTSLRPAGLFITVLRDPAVQRQLAVRRAMRVAGPEAPTRTRQANGAWLLRQDVVQKNVVWCRRCHPALACASTRVTPPRTGCCSSLASRLSAVRSRHGSAWRRRRTGRPSPLTTPPAESERRSQRPGGAKDDWAGHLPGNALRLCTGTRRAPGPHPCGEHSAHPRRRAGS